MSKYRVTIYAPDEEYELDELYDTEEEANEAGNTALSDIDTGAQILHMHNPGDYEYDEDEIAATYFEVDEVDD